MEADAKQGWSRWPAPAKLNLFLRIVGRREDGYHRLQTVFQLLDWGDEVALRARDDGRIVRESALRGVKAEDDLTVRAALALQAASGTRMGVDIQLVKRIPVGGGFGGGSSDAASVLVGLNWLWDLRFDERTLAAIGLRLGADVPVFVHGQSAWAEGIGEQLSVIKLPERHYLLLDPGVMVPTGELFQAPELTRNDSPITMRDFLNPNGFGNAFEAVLRARSARVDEALDALSNFGRAQLTGSGSGCFVAFASSEEAEEARAALVSHWSVWCARGVSCSGLRSALKARQAEQN
ncbi:MAG: 4-(cytidine 5'-diphospho)-2-C-methyl-D-erythritol kinase [Pseudomarimonas sp.]